MTSSPNARRAHQKWQSTQFPRSSKIARLRWRKRRQRCRVGSGSQSSCRGSGGGNAKRCQTTSGNRTAWKSGELMLTQFLAVTFWALQERHLPGSEHKPAAQRDTERAATILPTFSLQQSCPVLWHHQPPDGHLEGHIFTDGSSSGSGALRRAGWAVVAVANAENLKAAAYEAMPSDVLPEQTSHYSEDYAATMAGIITMDPLTLHIDCKCTIVTINRLKCKALGARSPEHTSGAGFWFPTMRSGQSRSRGTPPSATWSLGALPTCSKR